MLVDKLLITLIVGVALACTAFWGNWILEREKNQSATREARMLAIRMASHEAWIRLIALQESVLSMQSTVEALELHQSVSFFEDQIPSDKKDFARWNQEAKQNLSALWDTLQAEKMRLDARMHMLFFRAMQNLAALRSFHESIFQAMVRGDETQYYRAAVVEAQRKFDELVTQLLNNNEQLY